MHYLCDSYPDEFESTRIIGERQFRKAVDLFNTVDEEIEGEVDFRHTYIDFSQLEVTISDEGDSEVVKTCPAAMGFAFAAGTTDGPGAFDFTQGDDKVIFLSYCIVLDSNLKYLLWFMLIICSDVCVREILSGSWCATCSRHQPRNR